MSFFVTVKLLDGQKIPAALDGLEFLVIDLLHNFGCSDYEEKNDVELLSDYFQLGVKLEQLYKSWSSRDKHFARFLTERGEMLQGIRILRQEPVETLFAFICSANNNVPRISKMVEKLCQFYGDSVEVNAQRFYDFPSVFQMAAHLNCMEQTLRDAGFGYRAKSIMKTVEMLADGKLGNSADLWLHSLRNLPYHEAKLALMKLPGVGPKVADCICLMALDKHQVVPVDRHVFNLATEIYTPAFLKGCKTLSTAIYGQIGAFFVDIHGDYAGWAHSVLFSTRLRHFLK
ncbi:hypothetical protein niasHT_007080 [Heterodera trifolii]|uniref:DNA-(apurinic or apyrimidinic site) lyase n=1 Tax=Heterodera trifolii TaxID=157864 RepID=A0ABD2LYN6_9BILA